MTAPDERPVPTPSPIANAAANASGSWWNATIAATPANKHRYAHSSTWRIESTLKIAMLIRMPARLPALMNENSSAVSVSGA